MKTKNAEGRRFLSSAVAITVIVAIFTFLALLPGAFGANSVIFEGSVISGSEYNTSTGEAFTAIYIPSEQKLIIDFPGDSFIIGNKTCETGRKLQGCFDGVIFKGYNHSLPNPEVYEAKLKLSLLIPEIKIAKTLEKGTVEVGEETAVYVNITNTGAATATVYFSEKIPSELKLSELPDQKCQLSYNNTLVLTGDLIVGEVWHCDYKVTALSSGSQVLRSSASFDVLKRETSEASASLRVKDIPFSVTATYPQALLLGEIFNITFVLKSVSQLDSFVFNALVPAQLRSVLLTKAETAAATKEKEGMKVSYGDKTTSLNGTLEITVASEAVSVGAFLITTTASWALGSIKQQAAEDFPINVTLARPYLRLNRYDSETGQASIELVNPAHLPIFNVTLSSSSFTGLNNQPLIAEEIGSLSHAGFDIAQKTPEGTEGSSDYSNYSGIIRYYTKYKQELTTTSTLPINASQLQKKTSMSTNETPAEAPAKEQLAAEDGENKSKKIETEEAAMQKPAEPEKPKGLMRFRTAAIIAGMVIAIVIATVVISKVVRAKKGENKGEEAEIAEAGEK